MAAAVAAASSFTNLFFITFGLCFATATCSLSYLSHLEANATSPPPPPRYPTSPPPPSRSPPPPPPPSPPPPPPNDYCSYGNGSCSGGGCSCPVGVDGIEHFNLNQSADAQVGCSRITPLSCHSSLDQQKLVEVRDFTYSMINYTTEAVSSIRDMESCKRACSINCSCGAAFFRYNSDDASDGYCFLPSRILLTREGQTSNHTLKSASFIKVQIPSNSTQKLTPRGINLAAVAGGAGAGAFLLVCFVCILAVKLCRTEGEEEDEDGDNYVNQVQVPGMPVRFSYEDLRRATEEFKETLGRGGFGSVFKGTLPDGTKIAVKRLDKKRQRMRAFLAEVETIGSIHHFNLVRLIGFCAEKSNRLLVYEYMSHGSLDNWIYHRSQGPCLDWQTRKKIILDIAKGLAYLHEDCRQTIVHLDIKPQNILLDENFNAKVSDFGLSKLIGKDESQVLMTVRGTPGYLAPEWRESRISVKVDIYSFGIVLLEIVTGRRNFDGARAESSSHMLGILQKKGEEERLIEIVENLEDHMNNREEVERLIRIGAWCLQDDPTRRPPMSVVVKVLEGVMDVDSNIIYKFVHALVSPPLLNHHNNLRVSTAVEPSVLSNPR